MSQFSLGRSGKASRGLPEPSAVLELLKPVTWFAPMWAFGCGAVSAGQPAAGHWGQIALGILLAGPLVCATSQAANDWYDREVDAINEPNRPIPSGRIPGRWGLWIALVWTALSLAVAYVLGWVVFAAAVLGLALAWIYSAPPLRLKQDGWWGNAACGFAYESLPWITGAAILAGGLPGWPILAVATLYGVGAHGIMTLNDFKSIEGDRALGVRSLPVQLGPKGAAKLACLVMAWPQFAVIGILIWLGLPFHAAGVWALLLVQGFLMPRFLRDPRGQAIWYNSTGTTLYVLGMLVAAFGLGSLSLGNLGGV
jgi:chlorophyll synthase